MFEEPDSVRKWANELALACALQEDAKMMGHSLETDESIEESPPDDDTPSWEEIEEFIETVNSIVEAISKAVEGLETFVPTARMIGEMMLRMILAHRLARLWENRYWYWVAWRIAYKLPLFVLVRLPTRWLSVGLIRPEET